ncbi:hypothetical protein [Pseudochryseolinea flava]|uniref:Outer membrane protein beta-barrel domain-containing protein n=1 Tax=Pseudochryseolinea flava TaxID=2059302 RepID=A0A364Y3Z1_9BACT|nr:hypothetical protein [Pseudochryseolinea flava]RAW01642.1 hypothetical protein DQQ10_08280 [Pseudochryseolinea flava]
MSRLFYAVVLTISIVLPAKAQEVVGDDRVSGNVGAGIGLEYGGIGIRVSGPIAKHFALFGGVGHNTLDIALAGGLSYEPLLKGTIRPEVIAMVGANNVVTDAGDFHPRYERTYYGASVGAGIHYYVGSNDNFINIKAVYPIATFHYKEVMDDAVGVKSIPFYFSVGFHLDLGD